MTAVLCEEPTEVVTIDGSVVDALIDRAQLLEAQLAATRAELRYWLDVVRKTGGYQPPHVIARWFEDDAWIGTERAP